MSEFFPAASMQMVLPEILPIFPLANAVLLPHARLPLNIFEPRYLAMVDDALASHRMIGMIQPSIQPGLPTPAETSTISPVYSVGCAGRITTFNETDDGRYLIGLTGICRFTVTEELPFEKPYRRVKANWRNFATDILETPETEIDRKRLNEVLQNYFKLHHIAADWNAVQSTPNEMLVSSLVMICPLAPNEKQALLEAPDLHHRADMLIALLEMATLPQNETEGARH